MPYKLLGQVKVEQVSNGEQARQMKEAPCPELGNEALEKLAMKTAYKTEDLAENHMRISNRRGVKLNVL